MKKKVTLWLKELWHKYRKGAEANIFPIRKCGLFGGKLKNPKTLNEALFALEYLLPEDLKRIIPDISEDNFVANTHHNIGRWIRINGGYGQEVD